jgi:hypothetical protein
MEVLFIFVYHGRHKDLLEGPWFTPMPFLDEATGID